MTKIDGVRFGKRDKKNQIKAILPKGTEIEINGVRVELNAATAVIAKSHEDVSKMLATQEVAEVAEEAPDVDVDINKIDSDS